MQVFSFGFFDSPSQLKLLKTFCALSISVILSGCGAIMSGTGPYSSSIASSSAGQDPDLPYKLIDLAPNNVADYSRKAPPPTSANVSKTSTTAIELIPGDVIKIMISDSAEGGVFAPLSGGGTTFNNVRVAADGTISLPYTGTLNVRGYTLPQVDNAIRKKLKGSVATDPQVHSEIVGDLSGSVLVAGAVKSPGRVFSEQSTKKKIDALEKEGGTVQAPPI